MHSQTQLDVRYQMPALEELKQLAATAAADYEAAKGINPERKSFLTLVNRLVQDQTLMASEDAAKILLGAYVFELEHIEAGCTLGLFYKPNNSEVYKSLKKGLEISDKNKLNDELRLICISAFYNYIKTRAPKELTEGTVWMANEALRAKVLREIKLILTRLRPQINIILSDIPAYSKLIENLQNMEANYGSGSHAPLAKFIDLISDYCNTCLPQLDTSAFDALDPGLKHIQPYLLRFSAAMFAMKTIEGEWTYRSKLYDRCSAAISKKNTKEIDIEDRISWLGTLNEAIKDMLENRKEFIKQKEQGNYKNIQSDLLKFKKMISDFIDNYHAEKTAPSNTHTTMVLATSGVAQTGIQSVWNNVVGDVSPAGMIVDTAAGATGSALGGPAGSIAAVAVARFIRSYVIPFAVAGICAGVLDSAGNRIGEATTGVVTMPFKLSARGIKSLINWYRHVEIDKNALCKNAELLEALVSLPDDAFESEKKAKIENNYGIKLGISR
jgi:hypothetical protein